MYFGRCSFLSMKKIHIIVLASIFSYNLTSAQTSVELNIATERMTVDLIALHYFDKENRWSLFNRNRAVAYYDSRKNGFLTINSLAYNFKSGLGLAANIIGDNNRFYPSLGLQYEKVFKSLYLYLLATYEPNKIAFQENYIFLVYKKELIKKLRFVSHNEFYFSFLEWKNDISLERLKLGIEVEKTQVGFIGEFYQSGENYKSALINLGIYAKKTF